MVQSPSWEANWFAASQEIPCISRNPKVHYHTHKRPPLVPILGQPNPVHIPTSHLLEIHPNIIHPFTPRSPQWSLSLRFPHQDPTRAPLLTHTRHIPSPSHSSRFYHPHNIGWAVQIIYLLVMQSPPFPVTSSLLGPNILKHVTYSLSKIHVIKLLNFFIFYSILMYRPFSSRLWPVACICIARISSESHLYKPLADLFKSYHTVSSDYKTSPTIWTHVGLPYKTTILTTIKKNLLVNLEM